MLWDFGKTHKNFVPNHLNLVRFSYKRLFHTQMFADIKPRTRTGSPQGYTWTEFLKKVLAVLTARLRK